MVDARLEAQLTLQYEQFQRGIQILYNKIEKLQKKIRSTSSVKPFQRVPTQIQSVTTGINKLHKSLIAITAAFAGFGIGKTMIKNAVDAVESENLFTVSMGKMADSARLWSEEISKALGLNSYELRKSLGTFNVMLGSMGLNTDQAYEYSKSLVVLANDMASFYNISTESAFNKLRSGITGEVKPLKTLGINLSVAALQEEALKEGIKKKIFGDVNRRKNTIKI